MKYLILAAIMSISTTRHYVGQEIKKIETELIIIDSLNCQYDTILFVEHCNDATTPKEIVLIENTHWNNAIGLYELHLELYSK